LLFRLRFSGMSQKFVGENARADYKLMMMPI